ncbi:MAG: hypothetical protein ACFB6R_09765 [Alphaproteobacteria bacterium]
MMSVTKVSVSLPFGLGQLEWRPDTVQQIAAWQIYVELVTRISVQELADDEGLSREALSSLYSLFGTTRDVLKNAGPKAGLSERSLGWVAIEVLNKGLRPFLAKWHPMLKDWEDARPGDVSQRDHEAHWPHQSEFRGALTTLRGELSTYANALKEIAKAR